MLYKFLFLVDLKRVKCAYIIPCLITSTSLLWVCSSSTVSQSALWLWIFCVSGVISHMTAQVMGSKCSVMDSITLMPWDKSNHKMKLVWVSPRDRVEKVLISPESHHIENHRKLAPRTHRHSTNQYLLTPDFIEFRFWMVRRSLHTHPQTNHSCVSLDQTFILQ